MRRDRWYCERKEVALTDADGDLNCTGCSDTGTGYSKSFALLADISRVLTPLLCVVRMYLTLFFLVLHS